jgi:hypothetical protein
MKVVWRADRYEEWMIRRRNFSVDSRARGLIIDPNDDAKRDRRRLMINDGLLTSRVGHSFQSSSKELRPGTAPLKAFPRP